MAASLEFTFGILGNIVSIFVYLSPIPTFYKIYKKKSSEGFQSLPYVVGLFSAALWMYYALLNSNETLLITSNSFGCLIESFYIGVHLFYVPKKVRAVSLLLLGTGWFGLIFILTNFLTKGQARLHIVGWFCLVFSVCVFAAPLNIMKQVIRTKSVEFMPFYLSLSLTLSAVMWFFYGILRKDLNISIPNVIGFILGVLQMILYAIYKNGKKVKEQGLHVVEERQTEVVEEAVEQCIDVSAKV
ncbi:Bidirectional sugar transporter NEC1 [Camellia lanceoleosa]|uniref:Bidirectional sugar transporter NEC1 n=1 Tax=Camellia lanceoleosa TaxID=1840588 RepID=A0ACC0FAA2_9ERIC|nr:Bidirectional sugar transporter NEC1 [Camellia lanceoleosa]